MNALDTAGKMSIIVGSKYPVKVFGSVSFKDTAHSITYLWSKVLLAIASFRPLTGIQRQSYCWEHFVLRDKSWRNGKKYHYISRSIKCQKISRHC